MEIPTSRAFLLPLFPSECSWHLPSLPHKEYNFHTNTLLTLVSIQECWPPSMESLALLISFDPCI